MKSFISRNINTILWTITFVGVATIIILLFTLNLKTDKTVQKVKDDLNSLQRDIEHDHDGQDKLLTCLVDMFVKTDVATRVQVDRCVTESMTSGTSEDTAPANQAGTSQSIPSASSSLPNNTKSPPPQQSNTSQPLEPEPNLLQRVLNRVREIL